jgi:mycothiol system anti-sigma-R factor
MPVLIGNSSSGGRVSSSGNGKGLSRDKKRRTDETNDVAKQARSTRETVLMDCRHARESMFRECDNELPTELLAAFREHMSRCASCADELAYLHKLLAVVRGRCGRDAAPVALKVRILSSFPHRGGVMQEVAD